VIAMVFLAFVSADLWLRNGEHFTR
jgi:hypothetical protein